MFDLNLPCIPYSDGEYRWHVHPNQYGHEMLSLEKKHITRFRKRNMWKKIKTHHTGGGDLAKKYIYAAEAILEDLRAKSEIIIPARSCDGET